MKRKTLLAILALVIVLSVLAAAVAVTNIDVLTATGQGVLNPYAPSTPGTGTVSPTTPVDAAVVGPGGTPHHDITGLQEFQANGLITYEADGFRLVYNTISGVWHMEWDVKNNLTVPMTIQPYVQLMGCDVSRTGMAITGSPPYVFVGASKGCPARDPSVNAAPLLPSAQPSAADGTHDSTLGQMGFLPLHFQVSTLNIPSNSTPSNATNNAPIVGKSVRNDFLKLHPEANKTRPAADPVQLRKSVCPVDTNIGTVNGTKITLQPGQSATISSTVNSTDWGFACSAVNHALINYNVQAGGSTYKAYGASETIVFGKEESNICGS